MMASAPRVVSAFGTALSEHGSAIALSTAAVDKIKLLRWARAPYGPRRVYGRCHGLRWAPVLLWAWACNVASVHAGRRGPHGAVGASCRPATQPHRCLTMRARARVASAPQDFFPDASWRHLAIRAALALMGQVWGSALAILVRESIIVAGAAGHTPVVEASACSWISVLFRGLLVSFLQVPRWLLDVLPARALQWILSELPVHDQACLDRLPPSPRACRASFESAAIDAAVSRVFCLPKLEALGREPCARRSENSGLGERLKGNDMHV